MLIRLLFWYLRPGDFDLSLLTNNNFLSVDRAAMGLLARDPRLLSSIQSSGEEWPVLSLSIDRTEKSISLRR